jgi:hypothetical protein
MTELPNTVTEAQMQLREALRYSTDPAWLERQISPGPDEIIRSGRRLAYWTVGIIGAGSIFCIVFALFAFGAFAAERDRPHDLWLMVKPTAEDPVIAASQRNQFKIGVGYQSKGKCEDVKAQMRKVNGTLQCLSVE